MTMTNCNEEISRCNSSQKEYEIVKIEKTKFVCSMCEDFATEQLTKQTPIAILSCEGACLRGEIARQAANIISFNLLPEKTARICLGGAFTKNTGQRNLVKNSARVIALEGCPIECGSRMMKGVIDNFNPEIIIVDKLCDFDKKLFAINDLSEIQIKELAHTAATKIKNTYL